MKPLRQWAKSLNKIRERTSGKIKQPAIASRIRARRSAKQRYCAIRKARSSRGAVKSKSHRKGAKAQRNPKKTMKQHPKTPTERGLSAPGVGTHRSGTSLRRPSCSLRPCGGVLSGAQCGPGVPGNGAARIFVHYFGATRQLMEMAVKWGSERKASAMRCSRASIRAPSRQNGDGRKTSASTRCAR